MKLFARQFGTNNVNIGGDTALFTGIAKALFDLSESNPTEFPVSGGKAYFKVCPNPAVRENSQKRMILMPVRSECQFNIMAYDTEDRYNGISRRDVVLMNKNDMTALVLPENDQVTVKNTTGTMTGQKAVTYPIKEGEIMMYYPDSNILVPRNSDPQSKTPSFISIEVILKKEQ